MQYFKGDDTELKFAGAGAPTLDVLSAQKGLFFDEAFSCFVLGELLYDEDRAPLANAIDRDIFRQAFATIFDAFLVAGSFESYLTVFRFIFGDDVEVEFTVPAPGKLQIDITAAGVELSNFVARSIVDNAYVYDEVMEIVGGDNIAFRTVKGFQTQYEVEQMLFELVPAGIFTEISLSIGA